MPYGPARGFAGEGQPEVFPARAGAGDAQPCDTARAGFAVYRDGAQPGCDARFFQAGGADVVTGRRRSGPQADAAVSVKDGPGRYADPRTAQPFPDLHDQLLHGVAEPLRIVSDNHYLHQLVIVPVQQAANERVVRHQHLPGGKHRENV